MQRLEQLGVQADAIEEQFVRSGGSGGQHVNKVATCVQITYRAADISLRCDSERSQRLNRYRARVRLAEKLEELRDGKRSAKRQAIEKLRRQKRKRSRRAKEKMLQAKHHRAGLKARRSSSGIGHDD